jgi:type IV pilus assembly protein PilM
MGILFSKPVSLVGLDISSTAVKLLELSKIQKKDQTLYTVENYLIEDLPLNAVNDKHIEDHELVNQVVTKAVLKSKFKTMYAAIALPRSEVVTRVIQIKRGLSETETEVEVRSQAEQYIPYAMDDVSLDYEIMGDNEHEPEEVDVQFAAAKTENVDVRLAAANIDKKFKVKVVDIEEFALENAFVLLAEQNPKIKNSDVVALLDIGATTITYTVLQQKKIVYTREQAFGGKQLTEQIQSQYGLDFDTAERAKRHNELPAGYKVDVLEPFMLNIAQEVQRAEQYYYSSGTPGTIDHTILTGGCAKIEGLAHEIQEQIGGNVMVARLFDHMEVARHIKRSALIQDAPVLMIACGLALRSFDHG